jgi:glutamyl-tRNA synthetase
VGNLRTAIYNWLFARKMGGQFLTRLEDTDRTPGRYVPEGIWDIEDSLRYLGIVPDEWWVSGGPVAPYVQSERLPLYLEQAEKLIAAGRAYRCYCTRERLEQMRQEQQARGVPTGYDRRCRNLSEAERARNEAAGLPSVVRLAMPLQGQTVVRDVVRGEIVYENALQDDQVLLKSDGFPTYFLAAAVDDHLMGITHIIRGDDWLSSAPKLVQIYEALGWEPPIFAHAPLIQGADKKKLGKRHGATTFVEFIEQGYLPEALFNFLVLLGWSTGEENREILSIPEMIERFSLEGLSEHPAIFDYEKLKWMNGHYIRASQPGRIIGMCLPYLIKAGYLSDPPTPEEIEYARRVIPLEIERLKTLADIVDPERGVGFFFQHLEYPQGYDEKAVKKWLGVPHLRLMLAKEVAAFDALPAWTAEALDAATHAITDELGVKFAEVIHPTRVAATGRTIGPGLFETLWALGKERTLFRLRSVLQNHI